VGLPDRGWGEKVAVFFLPKQGKAISPEDLKSYLKTCLSSFKVRNQYIPISKIPKSPAGKILKTGIEEEL
jgi:fatty-acyl-CoA synthase